MRWKVLLCFAALATLTQAALSPVVTGGNGNSQVAVNDPSELNLVTQPANSPVLEVETTVLTSQTETGSIKSSTLRDDDDTSSKISEADTGEEITEKTPVDEDRNSHELSNYKKSSSSEDDSSTKEHKRSSEETSKELSESESVEGGISRSSKESGDDAVSLNCLSYENEGFVMTTNGPVKGSPWASSDHIIKYIDIPYGSFNRFEPPTEPEDWEVVHETTEHNKRCPQLINDNYVGDLDCLTLSVFAPIDAQNASVLFHIYDSKFVSGSADPTIYGPEHLVSKGMILVLPNYRVGPLGFLCLHNDTALGNAGLKDLTLALSWVHRNIAVFGGNPNNIAVSGDGTSGALVGYLSLSSDSSRYINKAITESGSVLSHWALDRYPSETASQFLDELSKHGSFETVDISTIYSLSKDMQFRPCLEQSSIAFIEDTPWSILRNNIINITFMIGSAKYAGTEDALHQSEATISELNEHFERLLPNDLQFTTSDLEIETATRLRAAYFGNDSMSQDRLEELSLYFTDASYLGPSLRSARCLVESGATVFLYEFGFVGSLNRELIALQHPVEGAVIGDLAGYIFTTSDITLTEDSDEKRIVDLLVDLWVSFINTGRPTAETITWNELKLGEDSKENWLSIDNVTSLQNELHGTRMTLWTEIYDSYFIERSLASTHAISIYLLFVTMCSVWSEN